MLVSLFGISNSLLLVQTQRAGDTLTQPMDVSSGLGLGVAGIGGGLVWVAGHQ